MEIVNVHLNLTDILMYKLTYYKINEHIASKQTVVKDQVNIEIFPIESKPFLETVLVRESDSDF